MVEKNILSLGNLVIFSSITGLIENIFTRSINFQFDLENFIVSYNRLTQLFIQRKKDKINNDRNEIEIITLKNVNISYGERKVLENIAIIRYIYYRIKIFIWITVIYCYFSNIMIF